jgi:CheY-like chemotaxis protein
VRNPVGKTPHVVAIDDNYDHLSLLEAAFTRADWTFEMATNGPDGLNRVAWSQPDLIVLDLRMSPMDGYEVLSELKANPETRDIPVVILTAILMDFQTRKALDAGAEAILAKPFSPSQLVSDLSEFLAHQPGAVT